MIKSPLSETDGDMLLYISNYGAPLLNDKEIFNNAVRKLNISTNEEAEALRLKNALVKKLETKVQSKDVKPKKKEQLKLVIERLNSFNIGNLLVSAIYPYFDAENVNEIYKVLDRNIQELLSIIFELKDSSVPKITRNLRKNWQNKFFHSATKQNKKDYSKMQTKNDLCWDVIVEIAMSNDNIDDFLSYNIEDDERNEFELDYENSNSFEHENFEFVNKVLNSYKLFNEKEKSGGIGYVQANWENYLSDYTVISDVRYREYEIVRDLVRIINNNRNIKRVIRGVK